METPALEFVNPSLGDFVNGHRVEIVEFLASSPDDHYEVRLLDRVSLVTACRASPYAQSWPSVWPLSARAVEQQPAAGIGERLEDLVLPYPPNYYATAAYVNSASSNSQRAPVHCNGNLRDLVGQGLSRLSRGAGNSGGC